MKFALGRCNFHYLFFKVHNESFSKSTVRRYPLIFCKSQALITLSIRRPLSPINLSFTCAVCLASIRFARTFFTLVAKDFKNIFKSKFNYEIGLQYAIYLLSSLGFSRSLIIACRCETQKCFSCFDSCNAFINESLLSSQQVQ